MLRDAAGRAASTLLGTLLGTLPMAATTPRPTGPARSSGFCLLSADSSQLAHIRLTSKPSSNALSWSATGWQAADE
ncbi:hypothetical protein [Actinomadura luteofluorescens]|uniref:hypothetical protein n=1 Tax=Actinomadura luteofluorescens TaxID=46163 RepID=UPI003D8FFF04